MKYDYHMHFEYGDYDVEWVKGFFEAAQKRGLDEIGISEHSHTFPEFQQLYYDDLILDDSFVGSFQQKWLKRNKFKHTLEDYFAFMAKLRSLGYKVKTGIEVCNFQNQAKVREILSHYDFDYVIGSIHFIRGWAYDSSEIKAEWQNPPEYDGYYSYGSISCSLVYVNTLSGRYYNRNTGEEGYADVTVYQCHCTESGGRRDTRSNRVIDKYSIKSCH